jgi:hypothetical protein
LTCWDIKKELTFQPILGSLVEEDFLNHELKGLHEAVDYGGFYTFYFLSACS